MVEGVGALAAGPSWGCPATMDQVTVVSATLEPPLQRLGVTHWSSRLLAVELGITHVRVQDLAQTGQPRRSETFQFSTDPELKAMWAACT